MVGSGFEITASHVDWLLGDEGAAASAALMRGSSRARRSSRCNSRAGASSTRSRYAGVGGRGVGRGDAELEAAVG